MSISLLLFVDDLILLASTPKGLQRQIDVLASFFHLPQLMVNLGKTKIMIFNASKIFLYDLYFYFQRGEIEITTTYTYLGIQLIGPCFKMCKALHTMFPRSVSRHLVQILPQASDYQSHEPLWFRDLENKLAIDRLDLDGKSLDLVSLEFLPPFGNSLHVPGHLLPTRQDLTEAISEDICILYIMVTQTSPPKSLGQKMSFNLDHFLELWDGIIVHPPYTHRH
jgi:hypothetical protein